MEALWIYGTGFLAQAFFSARTLCQWILSERARRVVSPVAFWALSIAGAWLLFFYGWLRDDLAVMLGQAVSYYIYLWNLRMKGVRLWKPLAALLLLTPPVALALAWRGTAVFAARFLPAGEVSAGLLLYGCAGQLLFTFRFVYQWLRSRRAGRSLLPAGFWLISLAGALVIASYGAMRADPVLVLGQSAGAVAYIRNLVIARRSPERREYEVQ